jgi:arylsulfatase A-like enzyme
MKPAEASPAPAEIETATSFVLAAWLALFLVLGRAGIVLALELAHHGDPRLAGVRLAYAFLQLLYMGVGIAMAAALGAWSAAVAGSARGARWALFVALFAAAFLFLWGRLDADPSRRIGLHTPLGRIALALAGCLGRGLAAFFSTSRARALRGVLAGSWRRALLPLLALALLALSLRSALGGLGDSMLVRRVERDLVAGTGWEVLRSHPDGAPGAGLLCPSQEYSPEGAARPALLLPPPARVRRVLEESEGPLWLVGSAGVDHSAAESADGAAARYAGHRVRFGVTVDGLRVCEALLPLRGANAWEHLLGRDGLALRGGARLELDTALVDPHGNEARPEVPLAAGFGGLALERRARLARTRASPERPSLVLVLLDTLRADRTSAYGYARPTTPNLEALARRGVLFEEAHATASWTWPSTASILTGLYPEQHGVEDAASSFLPEHLDTLPEALQRQGFTTAAWSGSPLIVPDKRFDQGFEFFDASREGRLRRSDLVLPGALEWLGTTRGTRFFLYLHLMEPHAPFVPLAEGRARFASDVPASFDPRKVLDYNWELQSAGFTPDGERRTDAIVSPEEQRWISDLYDGCVWSADHYLGLLLARLEELGLAESTVVAVTSDHGEELFDHGLLTHAHGLYRELVRVPLVLAGPGLPRGERVSAALSLAALGPALARLGGATIEGAEAGPGAADLLRPDDEGTTLFSTRQGWWNGVARQPLYGLRKGSSVLHFAPQGAPWGAPPSSGEGEVRLYDLARDPREEHDLAPLEPERTRSLRDELLRRLAGLEALRVERGGAPDEGTLEVLRGLGY